MKLKKTICNLFFISLPAFFLALILVELSLDIAGIFYTQHRKDRFLAVLPGHSQTILCLGDSFTEGAGCVRDQSYPAVLGGLLTNRYGANCVKVINAGRGGSSSTAVLESFLPAIYKFQPQVIIIMVGANNWWNLHGSSREKQKSGMMWPIDFQKLKIAKLWRIFKANMEYIKWPPEENDLFNKHCKSRKMTLHAVNLYNINECNKARKEFEKAIETDKKDFYALLMLAKISSHKGDDAAVSAYIHKAMLAVDDWQENLVYFFIERIRCINDLRQREKQFDKLKEYLTVRPLGREGRRVRAAVATGIAYSMDMRLGEEALASDLSAMIRIAKLYDVKILLLSYPHSWSINDRMRQLCQDQKIVFIDSQAVFEKLTRDRPLKEFFLTDLHCNKYGNKVTAEIVYNKLIEEGIIANRITE